VAGHQGGPERGGRRRRPRRVSLWHGRPVRPRGPLYPRRLADRADVRRRGERRRVRRPPVRLARGGGVVHTAAGERIQADEHGGRGDEPERGNHGRVDAGPPARPTDLARPATPGGELQPGPPSRERIRAPPNGQRLIRGRRAEFCGGRSRQVTQSQRRRVVQRGLPWEGQDRRSVSGHDQLRASRLCWRDLRDLGARSTTDVRSEPQGNRPVPGHPGDEQRGGGTEAAHRPIEGPVDTPGRGRKPGVAPARHPARHGHVLSHRGPRPHPADPG
jgi:hypothetical protein